MKDKFSIFNFQFSKKGFTLVELLVAVALFTLVTSMSIGALVSIFDANKRAESTKTVVDNLNFSIENMTRTVRFGSTYHCGETGSLTVPRDCPSGDTFVAVNFNGSTIVYNFDDNAIKVSTNGGSTYTKITSPETFIEYARFYVFGSASGNTEQPYVVAVIKGYVGNKPTTQSSFSIETLMSQRKLDL